LRSVAKSNAACDCYGFQSNRAEEGDRYRVWRSKQQLKFDLTEELRKIDCEQFAVPLVKLGYFSQGAFSELTEEILQGNPLFVHRRARVREWRHGSVNFAQYFTQLVVHGNSNASSHWQKCTNGRLLKRLPSGRVLWLR
jgi:hypothetical protein